MEIQEEDIRRYVNESIRRFVNEELSISNTVALKGNELTMAIMDKIMNDKVNVNSSNPNFNVLTCNFNYPLFDNFVIKVSFICYDYNSPEFYRKYIYNFPDAGSSSYEDKVIKLKFHIVDGENNIATINKLVSHEIEHLYQSYMKKGTLSVNNDLYSKAVNKLNSPYTTQDGFIIAQIIYNFSDFEEDAQLNELYKGLIGQYVDVKNLNELSNFDVIKTLNYGMKFYYNTDFSSNNEKLKSELRFYGKKNKWLKQFIFMHAKRLKIKIGKVIVKVNKDYKALHNDVMENFKFD